MVVEYLWYSLPIQDHDWSLFFMTVWSNLRVCNGCNSYVVVFVVVKSIPGKFFNEIYFNGVGLRGNDPVIPVADHTHIFTHQTLKGKGLSLDLSSHLLEWLDSCQYLITVSLIVHRGMWRGNYHRWFWIRNFMVYQRWLFFTHILCLAYSWD